MLKIRSGMFETNSSSTHTCVLCSHDIYTRWCKGELAWIYKGTYGENLHIKSLIQKYSKPEYIVEDDFVNIEAFKDIPVDKIFEENDYLLKKYNKKATKFTVADLWEVYITFDYQSIKDWFEDTDFQKYYDEAKKTHPDIGDMQEIVNSFFNASISPTDITYDPWNNFFLSILGVYPVNNVCGPGYEQEDITRKTIAGIDIIAYCTHGHD